jgi:hypothetical protein
MTARLGQIATLSPSMKFVSDKTTVLRVTVTVRAATVLSPGRPTPFPADSESDLLAHWQPGTESCRRIVTPGVRVAAQWRAGRGERPAAFQFELVRVQARLGRWPRLGH